MEISLSPKTVRQRVYKTTMSVDVSPNAVSSGNLKTSTTSHGGDKAKDRSTTKHDQRSSGNSIVPPEKAATESLESKMRADSTKERVKDTDTNKRIRRLSMKDILPVYVNQILPSSDSHEYPLVSYERTYGPGYLYVLCESNPTGGHSDFFKVGVTNDLKKRLCDLQNGNPRPLIPVRLIKVRNMESIESFLSVNLKPLSVDSQGGKDWYVSPEAKGKNALIEIVDLVKEKVHGLEIPAEKFRDYVHYYIHFSSDY